MQDRVRRVPPWMWLLIGAIYVICPLDFDFIPVVGWIDDAIVAYLCIRKWRAENAANDAAPADRVIDADSTGA
jgi:uncharacterized membrane protein YkvA (DUF1232 family)